MSISDRPNFLTHCFPINPANPKFKPIEAQCLKFRLVLSFISLFLLKCPSNPISIIIHIILMYISTLSVSSCLQKWFSVRLCSAADVKHSYASWLNLLNTTQKREKLNKFHLCLHVIESFVKC